MFPRRRGFCEATYDPWGWNTFWWCNRNLRICIFQLHPRICVSKRVSLNCFYILLRSCIVRILVFQTQICICLLQRSALEIYQQFLLLRFFSSLVIFPLWVSLYLKLRFEMFVPMNSVVDCNRTCNKNHWC